MSSFFDTLNISLLNLIENKKELIEVSSSQTISSVLSILNEHFISSLPVFEESVENNNNNNNENNNNNNENNKIKRIYIGIISIVDILVYINRYQKHTSSFLSSLSSLSLSSSSLGENSEDILKQPIRKAIGATMESSNLFIETEKSSLSSVINKMCQGLFFIIQFIIFIFNSIQLIGFHRCIVVESDDSNSNQPAKLLTQTDVVKYFLDRLDQYPHVEVIIILLLL